MVSGPKQLVMFCWGFFFWGGGVGGFYYLFIKTNSHIAEIRLRLQRYD